MIFNITGNFGFNMDHVFLLNPDKYLNFLHITVKLTVNIMPPNVTTPVQSPFALCNTGTGDVTGKLVLTVLCLSPVNCLFIQLSLSVLSVDTVVNNRHSLVSF
jgi:hypothetical protein